MRCFGLFVLEPTAQGLVAHLHTHGGGGGAHPPKRARVPVEVKQLRQRGVTQAPRLLDGVEVLLWLFVAEKKGEEEEARGNSGQESQQKLSSDYAIGYVCIGCVVV